MSRTRIAVGLAGFLASFLVAGAAGRGSWIRQVGGKGFDTVHACQATDDGGCILAGATRSSGAGGTDAWLVRLDAAGDILWQRTYGGPGDEIAQSIGLTGDGGLVVAGRGVRSGSIDAWCARLDSAGRILWQRYYGGSRSDWASAVQPTRDGGSVFAGVTDTGPVHGWDAWCVRLDRTGDVVWQKRYGRSSMDVASAVLQTADQGYLLGGMTRDKHDQAFLIKIDSGGEMLWDRLYGKDGQEFSCEALLRAGNGSAILAGTVSPVPGRGSDAWCASVDEQGSIVWQKAIGGAEFDCTRSMAPAPEGGFVLAGMTRSYGMGDGDAWCFKLDPSGHVAWSRAYGSAGRLEEARAVCWATDGGFLFAGGTGGLLGDGIAWRATSTGEILTDRGAASVPCAPLCVPTDAAIVP